MDFIKFNFNSFKRQVSIRSGILLKTQAIRNINRKSKGRIYIRKNRKHVASRPYHSPNSMTGQLRKSIGFYYTNKALIFGGGNQKVNYAKFLELGTRQIEPRPLFHLSFFQVRLLIDKLINKTLSKSISIQVKKSTFVKYKKTTLKARRTLYLGIPNFNFTKSRGGLKH